MIAATALDMNQSLALIRYALSLYDAGLVTESELSELLGRSEI